MVTTENMEKIFQQFIDNRSTAESKANSKSSRSHAIFRIETEGTAIAVVDLAGSERTNKAIGNSEQTSIINTSLLSLGNCIRALKERSSNPNHNIPYRESKLTKVLNEFFSPEDCDIVMIANLSKERSAYYESLKVLEYAATAKDIKRNQSKSPLSHIVKKNQN